MTRRVSFFATIAGVLVAALAALAAPAQANFPKIDLTPYYVGLGDSLAFGYQPGGLPPNDGYVYKVHGALAQKNSRLQLKNFGCPGESTTSFFDGSVCTNREAQMTAAESFLRTHRNIRLITINIGPNDVVKCFRAPADEQQACIADATATVIRNLTQIVWRLRALAPLARIVGLNHYDPFLAGWLNPATRAAALQSVVIVKALNDIEEGIYRSAWFGIADVEGAFSTSDTTEVTIPGYGPAPLNVARVCQWTWMCTKADIHANAAGYQQMASAVLAVVNRHAHD